MSSAHDINYSDPLVTAPGTVRFHTGDVFISGQYQRLYGWRLVVSANVGTLDTDPVTPAVALLNYNIPDEENDDVDEFHTGQDTLANILAWVDQVALATLTPAAPVYPAQQPVASFTVDVNEIDEDDDVQFTNTSAYGSADFEDATFLWDFGEGGPSDSTDESPLVVFPDAGVYNVTLTVTTPYGEHTSAPTAITVNAP